jgi:hypothetical protein
MALLVLAVWGLARMHCALEQVSGLGFLACCQHTDAAPHEDNDCDTDICADVESGLYQMDPGLDFQAITAMALWHELVLAPLVLNLPTHPSPVQECTQAPPELRHAWRVCFPPALSPRAPSLTA